MPFIKSKIVKTTAAQLFRTSLITFWISFLIITFIDYAGEKWLHIKWSSGPDLYPNMELGLLFVFIQLLCCALLLGYILKSYNPSQPSRSILLSLAIAVGTAFISFLLMAIIALYYLTSIMGRQL